MEAACASARPRFDVVIPTIGRPSLSRLLEALAAQTGPLPESVIVVDDRSLALRDRLPVFNDRPKATGAAPADRLSFRIPLSLRPRVRVLRSGGRGPASARNAGRRAGDAAWVVFLDDDVVPDARWSEVLIRDLGSLSPTVAASQGRLRVPLARARRPTDWERNVAGLQQARWASADIAYRREALELAGGFDERFARAYREDSDLALRVQALGYRLERGARTVEHPVGSASFWQSVRLQRGNADDALMRRLHGRRWRERAGAPPGRIPAHLAICASALLGVAASLLHRRRVATLSGVAAAGGICELAWRRIAPGPRTPGEVLRMLVTSPVIPFAASSQRLWGELRWRGARHKPSTDRHVQGPPAAVLFDRDGTLIEDVPYNGDPSRVVPRAGAGEALRALRAAGIPVAVISNQSGVARGLISERDVHEVNRRVEELLGGFDEWLYCPHAPEQGCDCRKPAPGLVLRAAASLGVQPERCAVIGDIAADVQAAAAAGARGVLVPNERTLPDEVAAVRETAPNLYEAVEMLLR
jgi:histidinol-phosphate phosphatase family protein